MAICIRCTKELQQINENLVCNNVFCELFHVAQYPDEKIINFQKAKKELNQKYGKTRII